MDGTLDLVAGYYGTFTTLYLPQEEIESLVINHMRTNLDGLLRVFPYFGNYPISVQVALWDMSYNLGVRGLRDKFPSFVQAVRDEDWEVAAAESERGGIADERNAFVRDLLLQAAQSE